MVRGVRLEFRKIAAGALALALVLGSGGGPASGVGVSAAETARDTEQSGEMSPVAEPEIQWLPYSGKLQTYQVADGYFALTKDYDSSRGFEKNTTGLLDERGQVLLPFEYNFINGVTEGIASVSKAVYEDWNQSYNSYSAYMDLSSGKQLTPFEYGYARPMADGVGVVSKWINPPGGGAGSQKYSLVNRTGQEIIPFAYDWIKDPSEGRYPAQQDGRWGFLDRGGAVAVPLQYESVGAFADGLAPVKQDGKWGYVDLNGAMKISPAYENAFEFSEGLAFVVSGQKGGFIDEAGNVVIPFSFDAASDENASDLGAFFHEGRAVVSKDGKLGVIDGEGHAVTEFCYERMGPCQEGRISASDGSAWGVLDASGKVVIPFEYTEIGDYQDGLVSVSQRRYHSALFDRDGRQVYPFCWTGVRYSGGLGIYQKAVEGQESPRYGAANLRGDMVIPFRYDALWQLSDRSLIVHEEESDENGNTDVVRVGIMRRPDLQGLENAARQVRVVLNGELLSFDQEPVIESGRTLVPMRTIFGEMGASVDWEPKTKTVRSRRSDVQISLTIGAKQAEVNGQTMELDVPAKILNGRTLVPLRFVAEAMDADVDWDQEELQVTIRRHTAADHYAAVSSASFSAIRPEMTRGQIESLLGPSLISEDREAKEGNGPGTLTYFVDGTYPYTLGTFDSEEAVIGRDGAAVYEDFVRVKQSLDGAVRFLNGERGPLWTAEPEDIYRYWDLGTVRGVQVFGVRLRDVDCRETGVETVDGIDFPGWGEETPCLWELFIVLKGTAVRISENHSEDGTILTTEELTQLSQHLKGDR